MTEKAARSVRILHRKKREDTLKNLRRELFRKMTWKAKRMAEKPVDRNSSTHLLQ